MIKIIGMREILFFEVFIFRIIQKFIDLYKIKLSKADLVNATLVKASLVKGSLIICN